MEEPGSGRDNHGYAWASGFRMENPVEPEADERIGRLASPRSRTQCPVLVRGADDDRESADGPGPEAPSHHSTSSSSIMSGAAAYPRMSRPDASINPRNSSRPPAPTYSIRNARFPAALNSPILLSRYAWSSALQ